MAGGRGDQLAIVAFVSKKKPRQSLASNELIPAEIDGVLTDVVEMSPLKFAVDDAPAAPELTATSANPNVIAITGNDVPGGGWTVAATITAASSDGSDDYVAAIDTVSGDTVASIGERLAGTISQSTLVSATFDSGLQQIALTPPSGSDSRQYISKRHAGRR